jgi:hypothetical protein
MTSAESVTRMPYVRAGPYPVRTRTWLLRLPHLVCILCV